jgi:predicted small integral membrane protein
MAWTLPTALFFAAIAALLALFTFLAIRYPETPRLGVLRIETTRGDRLFIGLLTAAYINLAFVGLAGEMAEWFALEREPSIWISFAVSMVWLVWVLRKG